MNNRDRKKMATWICSAAEDGRVGALRELLHRGGDPDGRRPDGATPLYLAAAQDQPRCVEALLQAGASPNTESTGWRAGLPLAVAATHAFVDTAAVLLRFGADPRQAETGGSPAVQWADRPGDDSPQRKAIKELLAGA
ncbi:ankyrin repeat domain-containing protein [Streptomyces sp. BI20]|uniref:ankyrin repeat domain-containing protein n=1 Tax=Streptomyces sp. BI20 TaxID=3403460 RepID=UPI003C73CA34